MGTYENLQQAIDFMEANLKGDITLEQIASRSGYSVAHFHRVFTAVAGCSAAGYLRRRRLSQAMVELMTARDDILSIALDYGFDFHEAFTRAFRAAWGAPHRCSASAVPSLVSSRKSTLSVGRKKENPS